MRLNLVWCVKTIYFLIKTTMEIEITAIKKPVEQKDEMFWFEFEGNQVRFLWKTLDPSIASWVFLLYDRVKKAREQRNIAKKKETNIAKEWYNCKDRITQQREYLNGLIRKAEYLEIQNKALIEYVKKLKKW